MNTNITLLGSIDEANPGVHVHPVYLFNEIYAGQQIHPEINKLPNDALSRVFFLFQHKHVMVEKLL